MLGRPLTRAALVTWVQHWLDVLFLHWAVPVSSVFPLLPPGLDVDTRDGDAWVSLVLFRLKVRPRWLPFLPGVSSLTEVNFRTYVRCAGRPGIYFLSMHADNRLAIWLARLLTPMPYAWARMDYPQSADDFLFARYPETGGTGRRPLRFRPVGAGREPPVNSLDGWLVERYRAFAVTRTRELVTAEVTHPPWTVRNVEMIGAPNHGEPWWPLAPSRPPDLMHFSQGVRSLFGRFRHVSN
jgi:uncharacterized protein YqjF (DUF2071 family)